MFQVNASKNAMNAVSDTGLGSPIQLVKGCSVSTKKPSCICNGKC